MEAFKSILTSKVIITNIVTAVASIVAVWGFNMTPETQAIVVSVIVGLGAALSSGFRVSSTQQLTPSAEVAQEANQKVAQGIPPKAALITAKAKVAAKEAGRA
jgi:ascorbate-specific PTS system EIIC-type component UlaA